VNHWCRCSERATRLSALSCARKTCREKAKKKMPKVLRVQLLFFRVCLFVFFAFVFRFVFLFDCFAVMFSFFPAVRSLGSQFKAQLHDLTTKIESTTPHFVRCIKSNDEKAANTFQAPMVVRQLRYAGIQAVVEVRRHGFPFRLPHKVCSVMCCDVLCVLGVVCCVCCVRCV